MIREHVASSIDKSEARNSPPRPVNVNLTDTVSGWWYVVACILPLGGFVAFIAGIVFMSKSKIGPALALWATCMIAGAFWTGIYVSYEANKVSTSLSGMSACLDKAQTYEEIAAC